MVEFFETAYVIKKFSQWFEEAKKNSSIADATEFCLATSTEQARPSARIVLLKKFDERGFVFFTNYGGRKSIEIKQNPFAAMCFYWNPLGKQIRIEGKVEKISATESDEYFLSRAPESRIGAWASKQSGKMKSREEFESELVNTALKFGNDKITRPEFWGGWRIIPDKIEFWQAGNFRYHNRELFEKNNDNNWVCNLLYP